MNNTKGTGTRHWRRELKRALTWHRRLLAAGVAAGSVALTIGALQPARPPSVPVLAAVADLAAGAPLERSHLVTVQLPPDVVPAGALRPGAAVEGSILASPVRRGEPLTDARIVGPGLLRGRSESGEEVVAAPVRLADAEVARLLRVGDRLDVLAADARPEGVADQAPARVVAPGVRVLAVPRPADGGAFGPLQVSEGALVVLATTPEVAATLARAAVTARLSVTIRDG